MRVTSLLPFSRSSHTRKSRSCAPFGKTCFFFLAAAAAATGAGIGCAAAAGLSFRALAATVLSRTWIQRSRGKGSCLASGLGHKAAAPLPA
eukprot:355546-Chlamydomonas_euryale.AAC.5